MRDVIQIVLITVAVAMVALLILLGISISMPDEVRERYDRKDAIESNCARMLEDAALGAERRAVRAHCDNLREMARQ